jgi:hypothetical protein
MNHDGLLLRGFRSNWALRVHASWWAILLIMLMVNGCGRSTATVSGTVTLDGSPVDGRTDLYGTVSFSREDGGGAPAVGIIKSGGRYDLTTGAKDGLEPGNYLVAVSVKKILPPTEAGGLTRPQRLSAAKFAKPEDSGLRAQVKPGNNKFDFAIISERNL